MVEHIDLEKCQLKLHYAWVIALTSLSVGITAIGFARFGYGVILPSMKDGLNLNYTQMGLISTANLVGYSISTLVGGFVASSFGYRKLITLSLITVSLSMILTGISQTFEWALIFRFLTGIGSGGSNIPRMALAALWFGTNLRGLAMGISMTGDGIGIAIGGWIIPKILEMFGFEGWRYSWYYLGALTLITAALSYVFLRDKPEEKNLEPLGVDDSPIKGGRITTKMAAGNPFRSSTIYHLGLIYLIFGFTYIIYATFFNAYLEREIGITKDLASWLWSIAGLMGIGSGFIWGSISDKIGRNRGVALVYLNLATSFLLFVSFKNFTGFLLSVIIFGIAAWATPAIVNAAVCDYFGSRKATKMMAFIGTVFLGGGQITGPWIAGYIADLTGSFSPVFTISGVLLIIGSFGALFLKRIS